MKNEWLSSTSGCLTPKESVPNGPFDWRLGGPRSPPEHSKEVHNPCLTFILHSQPVNYLVTAVYHCVIFILKILCFWSSYTIWDRLCMP